MCGFPLATPAKRPGLNNLNSRASSIVDGQYKFPMEDAEAIGLTARRLTAEASSIDSGRRTLGTLVYCWSETFLELRASIS